MSLELTVLRLLKYRDRFERLIRAVPKHVLDAKTQTILDDYAAFFKEFPEAAKIPHDEFFLWFRAFRHPTLTTEQQALYEQMLKAVQTDVGPDIEAGLLERLVAAETAYNVAGLLEQWNKGEEVDLYVALREQVERFEQNTNRKVKVPWVTTSIGELLQDEETDHGLKWRLDCLNMSMRPLRGGDFGIIAGRPDKGKTTFLTSELSFMAPQVAQMYNNERHILWLNNEGPGKRIIQRLYQSALNMTIPELVQHYQMPASKGSGFAHKLDELYANAMGGRLDLIRVFDIHDFWSHEVEDLIRKVPPGLIVFDMVDNVKFGGSAVNGGERTDQLLEAMYQWARVLSVKYDVPILATSQISADGDGVQWPTLSMLKDSKTGKQGAAEFIVTIGASNDPLLANDRYIGMTKNKIHRHGGPKDPRCAVTFDGERGRYNMPRSL